MNIVVCAKQVPAADNIFQISEGRDRVVDKGQTFLMNECDEYAVEEAIVLKQKYGGKVTVVTAGGLRSQELLYTAFAKGTDECIRIDTDSEDSETATKLLTSFLKKIDFDLILTGVESADSMSAMTGVCIAEELGLPHTMFVTKIDVEEGGRLKVERELKGGLREVMRIPLPALLCIQSGIAPLRYTPHLKLLQARQRPVKTFTPSELEVTSQERKLRVVELYFPESKKQVEILHGDPRTVARNLLDRLRTVLA